MDILVFSLMLLVLTVSELAITELFSAFFVTLNILSASLINALILLLLYAFPLWFFIFQPFLARSRNESSLQKSSLVRLFLETLAAIFLTEFLVMFLLGMLLPGLDPKTRGLLDAGLVLLIFSLIFLRIFLHPEIRKQRALLVDSLSTPLKLYGLLLLMIFLADLFESQILFIFSPTLGLLGKEFLDAFLCTLVVAPLMWLVLMRPLKRLALAEKSFCDALQGQVIDAIITFDQQGVIRSANPAAERIFGYLSDELLGRPAEILLQDGQQVLDKLVHDTKMFNNGNSHQVSREIAGRHLDGSVIHLDVSVSRVYLDDDERFLLILRDVGARKRIDEALRSSEERFRIVANSGNEGIWDCDLVTKSLFYTPRFAEMLGYQPDELAHVFGVLEDLLHPDDHDRIMKEVSNHLIYRTPLESESRLRNRSGNYLWFGMRGQAVWDSSGKPIRLAGAISDITSRKEAEQALQDSALRLRQIFEQIEDAVFFMKLGTSSIIDLNPAVMELFGYTREELLANGLQLCCHPYYLARTSKGISDLRPGKTLSLDNITCVRKDGSEIITSVRGKIMDLQGVGIVYCSFRDVTARIRMEEEARLIQAKLIQANKMTTLGLLVSGVAHEINNPNNYILTNTQLLSRVWEDAVKLLREYQKENGEFNLGGLPFSEIASISPKIFADIVDGTRRIDEIISNLKSFARQEMKSLDAEVDVNRVVATAVSILHHEIVKYTENFKLELSENIRPVIGSSQQLGQVMINLISNACQALPDRQRSIRVTTGFDAKAGQVTILVRDEGIGMSPDICGRIMEPFFTTKLDKGGTGLGLSICQSIIKEHNGFLEFASEPGKGTTVVVKIPAAKTAEKEFPFEKSG
ncbi:MAG: PAS domain S-box protein [Deltaproteobacteria bacterium]|nr:PAS domain S-box protein [Deltaproteobacteria bacterium]TLN03936.1 MAG: PAS domain S-box protein [bacterium]